jgi:hypothetical protein
MLASVEPSTSNDSAWWGDAASCQAAPRHFLGDAEVAECMASRRDRSRW